MAPASHVAKLLGCTAKELEGERIDRFIRREDGPAFLETLLTAYGGHPVKRTCVDMIAHEENFIEVDIALEPEAMDEIGDVVSLKGTVCRCGERR